MKIAIDVSPLSSSHKVRGVGFYLNNLKNALEKYFPQNSYTYFTQTQKIPSNVDLVHYPYFDPFFLTLPLFKKKKTIVTVHDVTPFVLPNLFPIGIKGKAKWFLQKKSLQKADAVLTDSLSSKKDIARFVNIPENKIHVAYLAAGEEFKRITDKQILSVVKKKYSLPEHFILYVGDVTANKNLPRLVNAALRSNLTLVMAGKALAEENFDRKNPWNQNLVEVQELAKENKSVIRLGFVTKEDLVALYSLATVFLMPSLYEGFGLPVLEAMACGCPVITSQEGSLKEVAGNAAYIVDAYSIDDIAQGLQQVIGNKTFQKKLSERGLQQAKKFSWEKTAKGTIEAYQSII